MSVFLHNDEKCKKQGKSLTNASFSDIMILYILYVLETFSPHNFDYVAGKFFLIKIKPCVFASKGDDEI